ncbi:Arm DNA-binding domain-containing protein [Flavobacterium sp. LB2P74]|uniref:Arm DNA-binding domain-containing protein n=1 Tax=Flavobacterium sp. LB2P74 TaxID=3401717 RepID=UPI003AAB6AC5
MNTAVSVLFYIKRSKVNNDGICPIYVSVTVQSKRFEFSSNKFLNPEKWLNEGSKVKGKNEETRSTNSHLEYLKSKILEAEKKLYKKDIIISSENLKNEIFDLQESQRLLIPIFKDLNNKINGYANKRCTLS